MRDFNGKEIVRMFYEKESQKTNQKEFRTEKVIKKKGCKLYVKWKGYDNSFNSWVDNLTAVENRITNVSDLVKKIDYDVKIKIMEGKYFTASDYNKFTNKIIDAKIK